MPYPKRVEIDGKVLTDVHDVEVEFKRTLSYRGGLVVTAEPAEIKLTRNGRGYPSTKIFRYACREEGEGSSPLTAKIVLQSAAGRETFTFDVEEAYVRDYAFREDSDGEVNEEITMEVLKMNVSAAADGTSKVEFGYSSTGESDE